MNDKEEWIAALASEVPARPSGLIPLLKRAPNSLRWRLIKMYWLVMREATGAMHRLKGRRIVHLLHIGKTGGTAIKKRLTGHENSGDYELVLHEHEFNLRQAPLGEKAIVFSRDPISRFVSGFYDRQRESRPRHIAPWSPGEALAFSRFHTANELALALSSDDADMQAAAVHAMRNILHLGNPQWTFFFNEDYLVSRQSDLLFIGFQETLNEDFELLKRILNLPEDLMLPADEVAAHKNSPHVDKRLDEEAIRNLRAWYRRDYRLLGLLHELAARIRSAYEAPASAAAPELMRTPITKP